MSGGRWDGFEKGPQGIRTERMKALAEIGDVEREALACIARICARAGSNPDTLRAATATLRKIATIGGAKANELGRRDMLQGMTRKRIRKARFR